MIYTCTMNLAIDLFIKTLQMLPSEVNRTQEAVYIPNGKGVNVSFILKKLGMNNTALGFKVGFTVGAEAQHQFSNALAGSIGLLYSQQGTAFKKTSDIEFDFKMKENNLIVPVMLVATTKYNIDLKLGLQPEFRVSKGFDKVLNKVNLSIPVGIAYEYRNVAIDLRYHIGVTHVYKEQDMYDVSRGKTVMLTLGYGFDL